METRVTKNASETQKLGEEIASKLLFSFARPRLACVIALYGDLGSGKTTFVQGFAKGLGIQKRIISPTFIIVRTYSLSMNNEHTTNNLYHIDLYRCETEKDLEGIGIKEILENPENIIVIEWPEKLGSLLPKKRTDIKFDYEGEDTRRIIIGLAP